MYKFLSFKKFTFILRSFILGRKTFFFNRDIYETENLLGYWLFNWNQKNYLVKVVSMMIFLFKILSKVMLKIDWLIWPSCFKYLKNCYNQKLLILFSQQYFLQWYQFNYSRDYNLLVLLANFELNLTNQGNSQTFQYFISRQNYH